MDSVDAFGAGLPKTLVPNVDDAVLPKPANDVVAGVAAGVVLAGVAAGLGVSGT